MTGVLVPPLQLTRETSPALFAAVLSERIQLFSQHQQSQNLGKRFFIEARIIFQQLNLLLVLLSLVFYRSALNPTILETLEAIAFLALRLFEINSFFQEILP